MGLLNVATYVTVDGNYVNVLEMNVYLKKDELDSYLSAYAKKTDLNNYLRTSGGSLTGEL